MKKEQKKQQKKTKKHYTSDFKYQAIELAKEIGAKETAEKLGIDKLQTLASWIRRSTKLDENSDLREIEKLKPENKKIKKELETERKVVAILKDATIFFCKEQQK